MSVAVTSGPRTSAEPQGRRLESWKEIASYLGRDITTARRWEKREGLPVHRLHHSRLGSVYAYTAELDAWRRERAPAPAAGEAAATQPPQTAKRAWPLITLVALGLILAGSSAWLWRQRSMQPSGTANSPIRSLAVLPLVNLSGDHDQDYLADGMTEALITELAQVPGLRVISRTSTTQYKGTRKTLPEIARELQADAIVEGAVAHDGNEIKITAQLIRAKTDTHVWAASYSRVQRDVLRLQTEVAEQITRQIGNELIPAERKRSSTSATIDPEAYEAYLKGTYFFDKQTPDSLRTALHYYHAAIGKDPNYASAYAKIAQCYLLLSLLSEMPAAEAYVPAREAAEKAVALDANLGEAHHSLADMAHFYEWDWVKADREYRKAIELNSNDASAHMGYSSLLVFMGNPKASAEEIRKARELDPISLTMYVALVYQLYFNREYDQALLEARKGLELYPDTPMLHSLLSGIYTQTHQPRLAAEEALKTEEYWGAGQERMAALRHAYKTAGPKGLLRTRIALNRKSAGEYHLHAYDIACDYAVLGDKDQSLYWL